MINIHHKTLQDLEFDTVLRQTSEYCITNLGKVCVLAIKPLKTKEELLHELALVNEYISSFDNENRIPNHGFDDITESIKLLNIENTFLKLNEFRKITSMSETVNTLLLFFKKFHDYYPTLNNEASNIHFTTEIIERINAIIDRFGEVKNDASDTLRTIRKSINALQGKINSSFSSALTIYQSSGYLDEIKESVIENRRVLAVKAMYRKKIKGSILGSSKTGSIVYIEPEATTKYTRELLNLEYEENEEVIRILKEINKN